MNLAPELDRLEHLLATLLAAEPANPHEWAEADAPWVTWTLPYTDRLTRVTGYATAELTCCICGAQEVHRYECSYIWRMTVVTPLGFSA